ncbi:hypothetical protein [Chamaesiphon sp. VAR_69_metabat_338]|uniref:hypothetical protein n=1 Tax=Chamaesiphon sp. VAR_69_metabat_338 TaxID=2964704 RepID=UPI00286DB768|nr:hypothetical protein [Chamaesiphon sp. VAR_69_metabat_338]
MSPRVAIGDRSSLSIARVAHSSQSGDRSGTSDRHSRPDSTVYCDLQAIGQGSISSIHYLCAEQF